MLSKKMLAALSLSLVALAPWPGRAVAQEAAPSVGVPTAGVPTASLPLGEVLRLYQENEKSRQAKHPTPPFAATVVKAELEGRLLDGAIDLAVVFEVVVLDGQDWVSVPLLERDPAMTVVSLPDLGKAVLAVDGEHVSLVTRTEGTYRFRLELLVKARTEGRLQTAQLRLATACMARLTLQLDANLFELVDTKTVTQGDTAGSRPWRVRRSCACSMNCGSKASARSPSCCPRARCRCMPT